MFIIGFMDFAQVMSSQNNWVYMNDVCLQKKLRGGQAIIFLTEIILVHYSKRSLPKIIHFVTISTESLKTTIEYVLIVQYKTVI